MKGADIVYYQTSAPTTITDAYSLDFVKPTPDISQDWTLLATSSEGGWLTVEASRALDTQDPQDLKIQDDSWPAIDGTRIIAAWGTTPSIMYHGISNRVIGQVRFFTPGPADPLAAIKVDPAVKNFSILQNNFRIPLSRTTYDHQCIKISTLAADANGAKRHMLGFAYVRDPTAQGPKGNVHHFVLSCSKGSVDDPQRDILPISELADNYPPYFTGNVCNPFNPTAVLWAWAPGTSDFVTPNGTGLPMLGDSGCDYLMLQTHYDNTNMTAGWTDNSGVQIFYSTPRAVEAGVFQLGDPIVGLMGVSPQIAKGDSRQAFYCANLTSYFDVPAVTVFYRGFHMHHIGERMVTRQFRPTTGGGAPALVRLDSVEFWDFSMQGVYNPTGIGAGYQVLKGDSFQVDCFYYNSDGSTVWGLGSNNEMCIDFIYYYPRQPRLYIDTGSAGECNPIPGLPGAPKLADYLGESCAVPATGVAAVKTFKLSTTVPCLGDGRRAGDAALISAFTPCDKPTATINVTAACGGRRSVTGGGVSDSAVTTTASIGLGAGTRYVVTLSLSLPMTRAELTAAKQASQRRFFWLIYPRPPCALTFIMFHSEKQIIPSRANTRKIDAPIFTFQFLFSVIIRSYH
jgi:hypothetical protein